MSERKTSGDTTVETSHVQCLAGLFSFWVCVRVAMANQPPTPPNSAGMGCYPGTDMTGVEMELLRELMRKAERNQMMTQTLSLHQLEHKNAPDPRQAEWSAQKAAGQWPGWKATAPPPKSVNPPASSGRPPKMNYDPNDDPCTWISPSPLNKRSTWTSCSPLK